MNKRHLLALCACVISGLARADPGSAQSYGKMLARHYCDGAASIVDTGVEPSVIICFPPAINSEAERAMCRQSMKEHVLRSRTCSKFHATRLSEQTPHRMMLWGYYQRLEKHCRYGEKGLGEQNTPRKSQRPFD